jgi:hypothetical protein
VIATLVTLVAAAVPAQDLLAKWLHALAEALEAARQADDSIAASNIVHVVSYLYLCKAIGVMCRYMVAVGVVCAPVAGPLMEIMTLCKSCFVGRF